MDRKYIIAAAGLTVVIIGSVLAVLAVRGRNTTGNSQSGDVQDASTVGTVPAGNGEGETCGNGLCGAGENTSSCPGDCPMVSPPVFEETADSATITWHSEVPTTVTIQIWDGQSAWKETDAETGPLGTDHQVRLEGLNPSTLNNIRITSFDSQGKEISSEESEFYTAAK